jgi:hypothetical protein
MGGRPGINGDDFVIGQAHLAQTSMNNKNDDEDGDHGCF